MNKIDHDLSLTKYSRVYFTIVIIFRTRAEVCFSRCKRRTGSVRRSDEIFTVTLVLLVPCEVSSFPTNGLTLENVLSARTVLVFSWIQEQQRFTPL